MRILIHDYAGHPFQVQLSRALAARGHEVLHLFSASNPTPKGALAPRADDPAGFAVEGLAQAEGYVRYDYVKRWRQERDYGRRLARRIAAFAPESVICCNTPLDSLAPVRAWCRRAGAAFVLWVQDLLGLAAWRILPRKIPVVGHAVGGWHLRLERRLARGAEGVVLITEDFRPIMEDWGVEAARVAVIENWAPLDDFPTRPKDNAWAREHGFAARTAFVYTGMMGLKHSPELVRDLALAFRGRQDTAIVVVSEGLGAEWLAREKAEKGLDGLTLLGFQPFDRMPEVMGAADVLVAVLEKDAGIFSVPSKVLSYLCAGRAILAAMPSENLAARILGRDEAGVVVPAGDSAAFVAAALRLADDPAERARLGRNAREYAMRAFAIEGIADRFEAVLDAARSQVGRKG